MPPNEKQREQILLSIKSIKKFPEGYPKLLESTNPEWSSYFRWSYEECMKQKEALSPVADNGQMRLV